MLGLEHPLHSHRCWLQRCSGETHENLSADHAHWFHSHRRPLHFLAETAVEIAAAVDSRSRIQGSASGRIPSPANIFATSLLGRPDSLLSIRPARMRVGALPPLIARTRTRIAGLAGSAWTGRIA